MQFCFQYFNADLSTIFRQLDPDFSKVWRKTFWETAMATSCGSTGLGIRFLGESRSFLGRTRTRWERIETSPPWWLTRTSASDQRRSRRRTTSPRRPTNLKFPAEQSTSEEWKRLTFRNEMSFNCVCANISFYLPM